MKELKKYIPFIGLILVAIAVVMLFLEPSLILVKVDSMGQTTSSSIKIPAFKIVFGLDDNFDFNLLGIVSILLLMLGAVVPLLKDDKALTLVAAIALIAGGVLMFVFPMTIETIGKITPAWPLIIAGIAGILAGITNLTKFLA